MKLRVGSTITILAAFVLGLACVHPIARAMQMLGITKCGTAAACIGGANTYARGGPGVQGNSAAGYGVEGVSGTGDGVYGQVNAGTSVAGVSGQDNSKTGTNNSGVTGTTANNSGITAQSFGANANSQAITAYAPGGSLLFIGLGLSNFVAARLANNGNLTLAGTLTTTGRCKIGCVTRGEASYGTRSAAPTLEDTGEAQLSMGATYVRLDRDFANAIDDRKGYYVLITPEFDTRGLYVAQRTPAGFAVRESGGGRSSGSFAYRIVGHPYGDSSPRLPYVDLYYHGRHS